MFSRRLLSLAALLTVTLSGAAAAAQAKPSVPVSRSVTQKSVTAAPAATGEPVDLNTATPEQLKAIPGIGDAFAKRIIDGRPYTMKNQLTQRGILPQATYDKVKDSVVARRPASAKAAAAPKK